MPDPLPAISRMYAGPFPALEERLIRQFFGRAGRDPSLEHVLLVPSNELREHLLKRLASDADAPSAFAGASVMTLYDFAVRLLKHRGIFPAELPPARMAAAILAAVRETYASGGGEFGGISATPGFIPALARTLSDLEEGCAGDAELALTERAASRISPSAWGAERTENGASVLFPGGAGEKIRSRTDAIPSDGTSDRNSTFPSKATRSRSHALAAYRNEGRRAPSPSKRPGK